MSGLALKYAHANVLFGPHGERSALYRVALDSYRFLPVRDKIAAWNRLRYFAFSVQADFSLYRVSRLYPAEQYVAQAEGLLDPEHGERMRWLRYLVGHQDHLAQAAPHMPELYLAVSLATPAATRFGASVLRGAERGRRGIEGLFGVAASQPISDGELERLLAAEERTFQRVNVALRAVRATTLELQWLMKRAFSRGVEEPELDALWEPNALVFRGERDEVLYQPLETDIVRLANAPLLEEQRSLVVDAEAARSHQAMLALGSLPEDDFPSAQLELLSTPLEALSFPVDAVLHARWVPNREAMTKVRRKIIDADNVYSDQADSSHGASYEADENRHVARELEAYLKSEGHPPLMRMALTLAVGAASREELEARVEAIRAQYGASPVLHRPLGLQPALFLEHLPGTAMRVDDYADFATIDQFAALMPTATSQVGSARGVYIGDTTSGARRPVKFDITEASREGRPPTILMVGTLGSGKTVAAQTIAFGAERRGSLVVTVDPKPDHGLHRFPELEGRAGTVELSGEEEYRGLLDPLSVSSPELREDLAASYLVEILPQAEPRWQTEIRRAVRDTIAAGESSLLGVIERMRRSESAPARDAARELEVWADSGLGRLAFGDGGLAQGQARRAVTVIRAHGLTLPDPAAARANYTQDERMSVATLKLVAAFAMHLASDPSHHAVVLIDEAWMLLGSADGRRLVDRLARLGRSQNATLILASQALGDIGELDALAGTKFIFGIESVSEAQKALTLLGLDPEDPNLVAQVRAYRRGRCLMRDLDDRIAEVQIDVVFPWLLEALDTSPRRMRRVPAGSPPASVDTP